MNVKEIVIKYLKENGFDGLYNENGACACEYEDICPWNSISEECKPGYKVIGEDGEYCISK